MKNLWTNPTSPANSGSNMIYPLVKIQKNYGKSPCLMGKSTISMAICHISVCLPEGNEQDMGMQG